MMRISTAIFCLPLLAGVQAQANACHICGDAGDGGLLTNKAYCVALSLDAEDALLRSSDACYAQQLTWSEMCCKEKVAYSPSFEETNTQPKCNICPPGEYPHYPYQRINMLYTGLGTCLQYWEAGQRGQLKENPCEPIKYFT